MGWRASQSYGTFNAQPFCARAKSRRMKTMKGPGIFIAQLRATMRHTTRLSESPDRSPNTATRRPGANPHYSIHRSQTRRAEPGLRDEIKGLCAEQGVELIDLSLHLQGHFVAVIPSTIG